MSALTWVAFLVAAGIGAPARYVLDGLVTGRMGGSFPWGTLVVNVSGSFVLGGVTGLALIHGLDPRLRLVLGTGFCGSFTTFSTFTFETVRLIEEGAAVLALRNVLGSLLAGAGAAAAGMAIVGVRM